MNDDPARFNNDRMGVECSATVTASFYFKGLQGLLLKVSAICVFAR